MGRVRTLISKDLLYASRDNILVYSLAFPVVFALLFGLFLPMLENMELAFAIDPSVPATMVERLHAYGRILPLGSVEQVRERVERFDDVPGIYREGDRYVVLLEGNEEEAIKQLPGAIIEYLLGTGPEPDINTVTMGRTSSLAREYGAILLSLTCITIGGLAIGLSIVEDRETRTIRALSVTPVRTGAYLAGKSAFGLSSSFLLALASAAIILGRGHNYLGLAPALATSLLWGLATGFVMGYLCPNQLTAIALLKFIAMGLLGIPVAAMVMPARFKWVLYPFPNYWSFEAMRRVLLDPDLSTVAPNLLAAVLGLGLLALVLPPVSRKFRM
jgi:ABC-2 type transport system permease protein